MYYSRVRRQAVASGSKRKRERENGELERMCRERTRELKNERVRVLLKCCVSYWYNVGTEVLMIIQYHQCDWQKCGKRGEYITSLNRVYYLDPSLQFWKKKKECQPLPHPTSYFFREKKIRENALLVFFSHFIKILCTLCSLTISLRDYAASKMTWFAS